MLPKGLKDLPQALMAELAKLYGVLMFMICCNELRIDGHELEVHTYYEESQEIPKETPHSDALAKHCCESSHLIGKWGNTHFGL